MKFIKLFLTAAFLFTLPIVFAEQSPVDSLKNIINKAPEDSTKVNALNVLAKKYFSTDPAKAIQVAEEAKALSEKINFKKGLALAFKNIGIGNYQQAKYVEAINYWDKAMVVYDTIG